MKKILVVDDNIEILNVIGLVLDMEGYEVKCSDNGHDVPKLLLSFKPDIILLDIMLGDMDGREICKMIKNDLKTTHLPVIMISASHTLINVQGKNCEADDFIAKPFDIYHLVDVVKKYIR